MTIKELLTAIHNMCYQCMGSEGEESFKEIKKCSSVNCPLHDLRVKRGGYESWKHKYLK